MSLPRFRFTVRGLMVVVAVAALLIFAGLWSSRMARMARIYRAEATRHTLMQTTFARAKVFQERRLASLESDAGRKKEAWAASVRREEERIQGLPRDSKRRAAYEEVISENARIFEASQRRWAKFIDMQSSDLKHSDELIEYHTFLVEKYERAARYPWLPVEPDPPEPE
jgi:hypothetical protein